MTQYQDEAWDSIQALFTDRARAGLADRVEQILDLRAAGGGDARVRAGRMADPPMWMVPVHGSGQDWLLLWHPDPADGEPYIAYAGPSPF